jgi:hypothetical protein
MMGGELIAALLGELREGGAEYEKVPTVLRCEERREEERRKEGRKEGKREVNWGGGSSAGLSSQPRTGPPRSNSLL